MPKTPVPTGLSAGPSVAAAPAFSCESVPCGRKVSVVHSAGALDLTAAPLLEHTLRQAMKRARLVVLDLRKLTRVDSSGIDAIVKASVNARQSGRRLVLVRGLSQVDRLLALTGASGAVEMVDLTAGEPALQALAQIARKDHERARAQLVRRVALFAPGSQLTRGVDALIGQGGQPEIIDR